MNAAKLWPAAIVAVLAITVAANVALLMAATGRDAPVAEPDYYRRGVAWDTTLAEARRGAALGWQVAAGLVPEAGGAALEVVARDREGRPLAGARVEATARHFGAPELRVATRGTLDASGRAVLGARFARRGRWVFDVVVAAGGDRVRLAFDRENPR